MEYPKIKIPFVNLKIQHELIGKQVRDAIDEVITGSSFTLGSAVRQFEEYFAAYCGVKYAVGVGSGTDALHLALRALGIKAGDEVITVPNTFIATVEAIIMCGAKPVFVDINEKDYLMDVSKIEKAITKKTKAIIPVHLYGQMADMEEICKIALEYKLKVIEDACQAHGALIGNKKAGFFGDAACFSFYPSKNLGGIGDGGIIVTNNLDLANKIKVLRNHGEIAKNSHLEIGFCSRLHSVQAAVLRVKLKYLDRWNEERRNNARIYDEFLKEFSSVILPFCDRLKYHVYHLYVIRVRNSDNPNFTGITPIVTTIRDNLRDYLLSQGIETGIHYPVPVHLQPALKKYGYKTGDFPVAERVASEILSLPMFPELKEVEIEKVSNEVIKFLSSASIRKVA